MKAALSILTITVLSMSALAAGGSGAKSKPKPLKPFETRERQGAREAQPVRPTLDTYEALKARAMQVPATPARRVTVDAEARVNNLVEKSAVALDAVTKRDLVENMKSIDVTQAVNSLSRAVDKMTIAQNGGRLNNLQQKMVEIAIEWLSKAKNESALNEIHMVFEDALKSNYSGVIAQILKKSLEYQKRDGVSLLQATRKALEERGISPEDIRLCKKGA